MINPIPKSIKPFKTISIDQILRSKIEREMKKGTMVIIAIGGSLSVRACYSRFLLFLLLLLLLQRLSLLRTWRHDRSKRWTIFNESLGSLQCVWVGVWSDFFLSLRWIKSESLAQESDKERERKGSTFFFNSTVLAFPYLFSFFLNKYNYSFTFREKKNLKYGIKYELYW